VTRSIEVTGGSGIAMTSDSCWSSAERRGHLGRPGKASSSSALEAAVSSVQARDRGRDLGGDVGVVVGEVHAQMPLHLGQGHDVERRGLDQAKGHGAASLSGGGG
jgi:hypothetical protein